MQKQKVIIIGAGPAGLTAGYELLKKDSNYDVTILEESNDIGGISKTINYHGNRMDIGGHRFFSKDQTVKDFWTNIMSIQGKQTFDDRILGREKTVNKNGPDPNEEDRVMLLRHRVSRIYYLKNFFDYPITLKFQTFKNMGLKLTFISGTSYLKSVVLKKEENNLENFYINRFGKKLYQMFFENYTEKLWGRHPRDISADWGSQRVKGLSITNIIKDMFSKTFNIKTETETSLIEEFMYPKYGPGHFWETVAAEFIKLGGHIKKNHQVVTITREKRKIVSVTCQTKNGLKEVRGDIFISSMPLKDLVMNIKPKAPKQYYDIAKGLPYRDFVTVGLLVKKLNIKNETKTKTINNLIPDCWIYVQEPNIKLGRLQIFNNWSPYMVKDFTKTVWLGLEYFCNENDDFWNMDKKDCINFAIDELNKMGIIDKENVIDFHLEKVKKAYPAYFDTYSEINTLIDYLNKYDNLYCVGRNGQHRYNNMDHSMMTAFETVKNITNNLKDKDNIWRVNTEKTYHETKEK